MKKAADLVFLWHMHQPDYRDYATGDFVLPWTYLHAIKDYTDMAYHLERHPGVHAVVNFVPILLDQIEDYCDQFTTGRLRDPLLRLLGHEDLGQLTADQRQLAFDACFRAGAGFGISFLTSSTNRSGIPATATERSGMGTFIRRMGAPRTKHRNSATRRTRRRRLSLSASLAQGMIISR